MELTNDRRLHLDASEMKLLLLLLPDAQVADVVTIEFLREYTDRYRATPATHLYTSIMQTMVEHFLEEAKDLVRASHLH